MVQAGGKRGKAAGKKLHMEMSCRNFTSALGDFRYGEQHEIVCVVDAMHQSYQGLVKHLINSMLDDPELTPYRGLMDQRLVLIIAAGVPLPKDIAHFSKSYIFAGILPA